MHQAGGATAIRTPPTGDRALMTRRAWWLLVLHLLLPGSAQVLAGSRRLGRAGLGVWLLLWALAIVAVVLWLLAPQVLLTLPTTSVGLTVLQGAAIAWCALWVVLTVDTLRLVQLVRIVPAARAGVGLVLAAALVIAVGGVGWGAYLASVARTTISAAFPGTHLALPANGRYNILLLGGDAGAGRAGLRPDSISVVSVNAVSGAMTMIGLPRNLDQIPFSAGSPMLKSYPHGYGYRDTCNVDVCELNSIYTEVQLKSPELYPDAVKDHSSPGIEATRDAVEGALGIPIQYYLLVDMGAFGTLIDALGGVTITVKERLPIGGGVTADGTLTGVHAWIEKGTQRMNGNRALWYARSRHSTSDYDRMARQRQLETALLHQMNPATLLLKFKAVATAGSAAVKTDLPEALVGTFAGLAIKARSQKVTTLELTPPKVPDPSDPDYTAIHRMVAAALH